jgi:hypothetical protein
MRRGQLIRIGGQCKDSRLSQFSERNVYDADPEVKDAKSIVDDLLSLKQSLKVVHDGTLSHFLAYYQQIRADSDPQEQRKLVIDATDVLMESIARNHLLEESMNSSDEEHRAAESPRDLVKRYKFLALTPDEKPSIAIGRLVNSSDGSSLLPLLLEGVAHYKKKEHWGDVLLSWLCGKAPLPQCRFSRGICCQIAFSAEIPLCDRHRCSFVRGLDRCPLECKGVSLSFCDTHACTEDACSNQRIENQVYCSSHACQRCVALGTVSALANDLPPRNYCDDHPLCLHFGCLNLSRDQGIFCLEHSVTACQALTKKGKPCTGKPISRLQPFCLNHRVKARDWLARGRVVWNRLRRPMRVASHRLATSARSSIGTTKGARVPVCQIRPIALITPDPHLEELNVIGVKLYQEWWM